MSWSRFVTWLQARWMALWTPLPPAPPYIVIEDELDDDIWLFEEGFEP